MKTHYREVEYYPLTEARADIGRNRLQEIGDPIECVRGCLHFEGPVFALESQCYVLPVC